MIVPRRSLFTVAALTLLTLWLFSSNSVRKFEINDLTVSAHSTLSNVHVDNLILVNSRRDNFKERALIRKTWGRQAEKLIFYVATISLDEDDRIRAEFMLHRDMIVLHMPDEYRLLTAKLISGFGALMYSGVTFNKILRTDDDVYVDVFRFWEVATGEFWGYCLSGAQLERRPSSEFYTSAREESQTDLPIIVTGFSITLTYDAFKWLTHYMINNQTFWNDDNVVAFAMNRMGYVPECSVNICADDCGADFSSVLTHHLTFKQMLIQHQVRGV